MTQHNPTPTIRMLAGELDGDGLLTVDQMDILLNLYACADDASSTGFYVNLLDVAEDLAKQLVAYYAGAPQAQGYQRRLEDMERLRARSKELGSTFTDRYVVEYDPSGLSPDSSTFTDAVNALITSHNIATDAHSDIRTAVGAEASTRASADATEKAAREAADTALGVRIDGINIPDISGLATKAEVSTESGERKAADTSLGNRVAALESASGSTDLSGLATKAELSAESTARENADTALGTRIDGRAPATHAHDESTITGLDDSLRAKADAVDLTAHENSTHNNDATARADAARAEAQAVQNKRDLTAEIAARESGDMGLATRVKALEDGGGGGSGDVTTDQLSAERTARENADAALGKRITDLDIPNIPDAPANKAEAAKYELSVPATRGDATWVEASEGGGGGGGVSQATFDAEVKAREAGDKLVPTEVSTAAQLHTLLTSASNQLLARLIIITEEVLETHQGVSYDHKANSVGYALPGETDFTFLFDLTDTSFKQAGSAAQLTAIQTAHVKGHTDLFVLITADFTHSSVDYKRDTLVSFQPQSITPKVEATLRLNRYLGKLTLTPSNIATAADVQRDFQAALSDVQVDLIAGSNQVDLWMNGKGFHAVDPYTPADTTVFDADVNATEALAIALSEPAQGEVGIVEVLAVFRKDGVYVGQIGTYLTIGGAEQGGGTPDDGSVTTEKIAFNAVTTEKIALRAVDESRLGHKLQLAALELVLPATRPAMAGAYEISFSDSSVLNSGGFYLISLNGINIGTRTAWTQQTSITVTPTADNIRQMALVSSTSVLVNFAYSTTRDGAIIGGHTYLVQIVPEVVVPDVPDLPDAPDNVATAKQYELNVPATSGDATWVEAAGGSGGISSAAADAKIQSHADDADAHHTPVDISGKADKSEVTAEATARQNADNALGTRINAKADTSALTTESNQRKAADTALGGRIDLKANAGDLTSETTARQNADTALGKRITDLDIPDLPDAPANTSSAKKYELNVPATSGDATWTEATGGGGGGGGGTPDDNSVSTAKIQNKAVTPAKLADEVARYKGAWVASTTYVVGDVVTRSSNEWRCITANSNAIFTSSEWEVVTANKLPKAPPGPSTGFNAGNFVLSVPSQELGGNPYWSSQAPVPPKVQTLTSATAITFNVSSGEIADVTLAHNTTLTVRGGFNDGLVALLRVKQDATGSRTLTLASGLAFAPAPTLTTTAGKTDLLMFHRIGTAWKYIGIVKED